MIPLSNNIIQKQVLIRQVSYYNIPLFDSNTNTLNINNILLLFDSDYDLLSNCYFLSYFDEKDSKKIVNDLNSVYYNKYVLLTYYYNSVYIYYFDKKFKIINHDNQELFDFDRSALIANGLISIDSFNDDSTLNNILHKLS